MMNFIRNAEVKAMTAVMTAKEKARGLCSRAKNAVCNREGQGTLDVAITVLISIVLGALILGGLYLIVNGTVLPTITQKIKDMLNMHVFWGVACMVLAVKTPKFLQDFLITTGGGGGGAVVNNVYHSVRLVQMLKKGGG